MSVLRFPVERTERASSDRLAAFDKGRPGFGEPLPDLGTSEDWAWSAVVYLKGKLDCTQSGKVEVSGAALSIALMFLEELAQITGTIPPSGGAA